MTPMDSRQPIRSLVMFEFFLKVEEHATVVASFSSLRQPIVLSAISKQLLSAVDRWSQISSKDWQQSWNEDSIIDAVVEAQRTRYFRLTTY